MACDSPSDSYRDSRVLVLLVVTRRYWFARHRDTIIPALVTIAAALVIGNLVRHGILTASRLGKNKDALAALQSATQIIILVLGGVFSYYRFFRGRIFISRADLTLTTGLVETPDATVHAVTLELKNLGTTTIWQPKPSVTVRVRRSAQMWEYVDPPVFEADDIIVVDSGETASFTTVFETAKTDSAVEISAQVRSMDNIVWRRLLVVANKKAAA